MGSLEINAIRDYLVEVGGKIEYPHLVHAFKKHLYNPDPGQQAVMRTNFKDYVNRLATVTLENNMKFIVLRPEFCSEQKPRPVGQQSQPTARQPVKQVASPRAATRQPVLHKQSPPLAPPPPPHPHFNQDQPPPPPPHKYQQTQQAPQHPPLPPPTQPPQQQQQLHQSPEYPQAQQPKRPLKQQQNPPQRQLQQQFVNQGPQSMQVAPSSMMPPPNPPPRRRQSTASLFKQAPKSIEKSYDIQDFAKKIPGKVKEHALRFNSSFSSADMRHLMPVRSNTMKENRLSRDSTIGSLASALQRNNLQMTSHSRSFHREEIESDSSSLQPIDPLRRRWIIEACNCNYNGLLTLLREDQKLAHYKDIVNGYTALHWAAKFGNLDIIKLIAGTYGVSPNIKSSAGYTPLHIAAIFNRPEAAELLLRSYRANPDIRDHSGKRPKQYWPSEEPIRKRLPSTPLK